MPIALNAAVHGVLGFMFTQMAVGLILLGVLHGSEGNLWAVMLLLPAVVSSLFAWYALEVLTGVLKRTLSR